MPPLRRVVVQVGHWCPPTARVHTPQSLACRLPRLPGPLHQYYRGRGRRADDAGRRPISTAGLRLITFSKKALSNLRKESRTRAASLQCFTSQGAGTQHPIHFCCAPSRNHTTTANSQTQQQQAAKQALQSKQHSNRNLPPLPTASAHTSPCRISHAGPCANEEVPRFRHSRPHAHLGCGDGGSYAFSRWRRRAVSAGLSRLRRRLRGRSPPALSA